MSADVFNTYPVVLIVVIGAEAASVPATAGVTVLSTESGAPTDLLFLRNQIRTLDPSRFTGPPVGIVPPDKLGQIVERLKVHLDLP